MTPKERWEKSYKVEITPSDFDKLPNVFTMEVISKLPGVEMDPRGKREFWTDGIEKEGNYPFGILYRDSLKEPL